MTNQEKFLQIIVSPYITNKGYKIAENTSYVVFKVANRLTKLEIKKAVEFLFEVKVDAVKTINVKAKKCQFRRIAGRTKNWKKAYVKLQEGHNISFASAE